MSICKNCGKEVVYGKFVQGDLYCDECFRDMVDNAEVYHCGECGGLFYSDDLSYIKSEDIYVCDSCYNRYFTECNDCGEVFRYTDMYSVTDSEGYGNYVCDDCIRDYEICDDCGRYFRYYDNFNHDDYICDECYEERHINDSLIREYHDRPDYVYFTENGSSWRIGNENYIGSEIEIETESCKLYNEEIAEEVKMTMGERCYFNSDGSLNEGFEIITMPHTYEAVINSNEFKNMFDELIEFGAKSHDTSTCGLHFHFSRTFFGDTYEEQQEQIVKLVQFFDDYYDELVKFARRRYSECDEWAKKSAANEYRMDEINKTKNQKEKKEVYKNTYLNDLRYRAVNLTNSNTVEIRICKGTLLYSTYIASMDLFYNLIKNSHDITEETQNNLNVWFKGLREETKDYMRRRKCFEGGF